MLGAVTIVLLSFLLLLIIFYNAMCIGFPVLISEKVDTAYCSFYFIVTPFTSLC